MKRLILCLASLLVIFVPIVTSLVNPLPVAAASSLAQQAFNACNNAYSGNIGECVTGYEAGYNGTPEPKGSNGFYDQGYKLGVQAKVGKGSGGSSGNTPQPPGVSKAIAQKAFNYCNNSYSGDLGNCTAGYEWGYTGGAKPAVCNSFCVDGYAQGVTDLGSDRASAPSGCPSGAAGDTLLACKAGASGGSSGKSESSTCGSYSGSVLAACQAAWTANPPAATAPTVTCDTSGNPLTWIICPIISGLQDLVSGLDTEIDSLLAVGTTSTSTDQPTKVFCPGAETGTCGDYYTAWGDFRDIALGLMVVAGLLIVIAQALGMEVLDAYTIRRALPRLLVAAIAITLSWPLMEFFVVLSNDLGYGISALISHPFSGVVGSFSLNGTNGLFTSLAGAVALGTLGVFGLLSFIGTAAIAVIIAFLVLVVRQLVIIMLVLIAPIAIVAYILPNTQRVYHLWRDIFTKTLLMFPMIAALIAVGRDFAAVALQAAPGSGTVSDFIQQIIALIAYFGPYFAIPLTFQFAGGIMSTVGNAVNSRGEGARGLFRNIRSNQAKQNIAAMKTGQRFEGKRWIPGSTKAANAFATVGVGVGTGWKGRFGVGKRGAEARAQAIQTAAIETGKTPGMQAIKGKNDYNRILAMAAGDERRGREGLYRHLMTERGDDGRQLYTHEQAMERVDIAAKAAKAAGGFTKAHGVAAYYNMARDGTAIRDTDDLANLAAINGGGNNNATFTYAAEGAAISRQAGRSDLAAASEPIGALAFAYSDTMFNKGLYNSDRGTSLSALPSLSASAWASGAGGEVAYTKFGSAKGRTVRNDTRRAVDIMRTHRAAQESGAASPYSAQQVQFAAATLVDTQNAIDNNYGKLNNRNDATAELARDEGSLNWYLDSPTGVMETQRVAGPHPSVGGAPVYSSSPRTTTNREVVKKIVGDRYANLNPSQREEALRRAATEEDEGG